MINKIATDYGVITINRSAVEDLIEEALLPWKGSVFECNYRDQSQEMIIRLAGYQSYRDTKIEELDGGIFIRMPIVMKFGLSIKDVTGSIIESLAGQLRTCLGFEVTGIEVRVTGMIYKGGITKRNIIATYSDSEGMRLRDE